MDDTAFDLEFSRRLRAPRGAVWRCWTEPALLQQWFCPRPWSVSECRIDLRPGGRFDTVFLGPEGERHDNVGIWLDVVAPERLVFTSALTEGWRPAAPATGMPPLSIVVTFREGAGGGTVYAARALHADAAGRDAHAAMGFELGWSLAADQLEALALTL